MLNLVELEPNAVVTRHSHPHEQLGMILRGSMTLEVDGTESPQILGADAEVAPDRL